MRQRAAGPWAAFGVAVLVSAMLLFSPGSRVRADPPWADEAVHLLVFAVLAVTGLRCPVPARTLLVTLAGYAVASELVQALLPIDRSGTVRDVLVDVVGVALGAAALTAAERCARISAGRRPRRVRRATR